MTDIRHYYLIDMENVGLQGLHGLNLPGEGSGIILFLSKAAHVATNDVKKDILASRAVIRTFFCNAQTKNAMDFEMAAYLGALLTRPETERISIISRDNGFKALVDYAGQVRKNVPVFQARSILEAYVVAESLLYPGAYEKGKSVDLQEVMQEKLEMPVRETLSGELELSESEIRKVLQIVGDGSSGAKERYLNLLKTFGREKGTAIYRLVKKQ